MVRGMAGKGKNEFNEVLITYAKLGLNVYRDKKIQLGTDTVTVFGIDKDAIKRFPVSLARIVYHTVEHSISLSQETLSFA